MKRGNFEGNKKRKQEEAIKRNEEWNRLTPEQQLKELDIRLGKDKGASKQRNRLNKLISKEN